VLIVLAVIELMILKNRKLTLVYSLIMFGGVMVEVVAIYLGAWHLMI
jgi:hypothetical protein